VLTTIERVLLLGEFPLLRSLPTAALVQLALVASEVVDHPGGIVWHEGDAAAAIYFVIAGTIGVQGSAPDLRTLGAGQDLGASALVAPGPRATTATVLRPAVLLRVGRDDFFEVLGAHPDAARALFELLGARLGPAAAARLDAQV
jgi:CRP-like cAMP-binding protein